MGKPPAILANGSNTLLRPLSIGFAVTGLAMIVVLPALSMPSITDSPGCSGPMMGVLIVGPFRVPKSLEILREERKRTAEERDAFKQFATQVNQLTPTSPQIDSPATVPTTPAYSNNSPSRGVAIKEVCQIYCDTVLDTNHHEEDYGDSEIESMAAEFGVDLANAVLNGDTLTASLQELLATVSTESAGQRGDFLKILDAEISTLNEVRQDLEDISRRVKQSNEDIRGSASIEELVGVYEDIKRIEEECESLLQQRQGTNAELPQVMGVHLNEYLYTDQDWTYPALSDTLDILTEVRNQEQRVTQKLSSSLNLLEQNASN